MKRIAVCLLLFAGLWGALWFPVAAAQGGARKVTVTLVRWPYT